MDLGNLPITHLLQEYRYYWEVERCNVTQCFTLLATISYIMRLCLAQDFFMSSFSFACEIVVKKV